LPWPWFAGLAWFLTLTARGWLLHSSADAPRLGPLSYPFLLCAGGLLIGFLLTLLGRTVGEIGGRRRKLLAASELRDCVALVAGDRLLAPVQLVLDRHRTTREHLDVACGAC
jgi:hypothetical protein